MPSLESPGANARRELPFQEDTRGFSLILKRNCSISPAGLACVFAALAVAVLAIGTGFALLGAWLILPFAGLEVLLLAGAFLLQARHAADYERIELADGRLRVAVAAGGRLSRYDFDARSVRIAMDEGTLFLRGPRASLQIGRHLDTASRERCSAELKRRLRI
ncbi:MAG: DUF2244 domain-containing protein [Burkholderiales bacterium]